MAVAKRNVTMTATGTKSPLRGDARKPRDDEIDVYGLTHPGKVRAENQDHFLICALKKQTVLRLSSLPRADELMGEPERLASVAMVADGVGGGTSGELASRRALEAVTQYVTHCVNCYYAAGEDADRQLHHALQEGAILCHAELLRRGEEDPRCRGMATTLTLYLGVWPRAYLLQVGDSRCYLLRGDELTQITRDQTMAQDLVDLGVLSRSAAAGTRFANILSSAIGGRHPAPVVTAVEMTWGNVLLLCSDGLTKHVPDERIRERLRSMKSAREACETLMKDALDAGGIDNITIVVGRAVRTERGKEGT
jgi:serine/threonine protein phosphatase PrpC